MTLAALWASLWGVLAVLAGRIAWCNLRGLQRTGHTPPLEVDEILAQTAPPSAPDLPWPAPDELVDYRIAAAYRDYARERRETVVLMGELVLLTAGAALGASLPAVMRGGWHAWPAGLSLLAGALGVYLKRQGEQKWTHVASRYERRRSALRARSPKVPRRPRRRGRAG